MWSRFITVSLVVGALLGWPAVSGAQEADEKSELAKKVQNPIANLVTVPFQYNLNIGIGDFDRTSSNLNFQPVVPFTGKKWNWITRTIIPVNSVPVGETGSVSGFGDVNLSVFMSPAKASALTWGLGPVIYLPTASNEKLLGTGKVSLGPTGVLFYGSGKFTLGGVASNAWSVTGDSNRESVNFFFAQYFINYNFGKGWALGTAPILTADWNAPSGDEWTVPVGLQISKVTSLGSRPANLLMGYYSNVVKPNGGADGQWRIQVNLIYPQKPKP